MYKQGTSSNEDFDQRVAEMFCQRIREGKIDIPMNHEDIIQDRLDKMVTLMQTINETLIKSQETNAQLLKLLTKSQ